MSKTCSEEYIKYRGKKPNINTGQDSGKHYKNFLSLIYSDEEKTCNFCGVHDLRQVANYYTLHICDKKSFFFCKF